VKRFVAALLAATVLVGLLSNTDHVTDAPVLFGLLLAGVIVLDVLRIDLFARANVSPASAPTVALACFFGPLGPLAAEALIAVLRCARREKPLRFAFDFGALTLAGSAAALAFALMSPSGALQLICAGIAAGFAYYAVNAVLLSVVMGLSEGGSPVAAWRERLAWLVPHYLLYGAFAGGLVTTERQLGLAALAVFAFPLLALWVAQKQYVDRSRSSVEELRRNHDELAATNARLQGLLDEKRDLLVRVQRSYLSTITSLARTIEAKDPYTGGHTERVARVVELLAAELGLRGEELRAAEVGAIIHDIGKIGIPDHILLKPGRLEETELAEMRRHPEISSYIVAELDVPPIVKQMVRSHHERYDGMGYPDGLAREEIPLAARILAVADTLDAMTSTRSYRRALPLDVAIHEILSLAGQQFCPRVVAALTACLERDPQLGGMFADEDEALAA
jgi:putative nucleotidyltransferase with HDIG domain